MVPGSSTLQAGLPFEMLTGHLCSAYVRSLQQQCRNFDVFYLVETKQGKKESIAC